MLFIVNLHTSNLCLIGLWLVIVNTLKIIISLISVIVYVLQYKFKLYLNPHMIF